MRIEAVWQKGLHFKCSSASNHTIDIDSGLQDSNTKGPSPMEVLLEAAACCAGMDVVSILQKKRKEPEKFSITVLGKRAESHPRKFTEVNIHFALKKDGLTENDVEHAIKLSIDKYCSVIGTITPAAEITWNYELKN